MPKPSKARMGMLASIAAAMGIVALAENTPTAQIFKAHRGKAPAGKKWKYSGVYIPGGPNPNVQPTRVRNPKVAAHVQMMHEKWEAARVKSLNESMSNLERKMTNEQETPTA